MHLTLEAPWLVVDLGAPHAVLSWAVHRPGAVVARRLVWREVRDADLTEDLDVVPWLAEALARAGLSDAVGLITSRALTAYRVSDATVEGVTARCVATVGLSNAERVGARHAPAKIAGTVNIAAQLSVPLSAAAMLEAMSLAAQAKTLAVLEAALPAPDGFATGTGTDCIAVAAPLGEGLPYAGLHTAAGEALGQAVLAATRAGVADWLALRATWSAAGSTAQSNA
jgi:adenosylcobinamide amidohydrolase